MLVCARLGGIWGREDGGGGGMYSGISGFVPSHGHFGGLGLVNWDVLVVCGEGR